MNIITIDRDYIIGELNRLPPQSRKRAGLHHVLRYINRLALEEDRVRATLAPWATQFPIWCQDAAFLYDTPAMQQIAREDPEQADRISGSW